MAEEVELEKKKVYVETTVVSDATALPTNDLTLAGRQMATREWWKTAAERFDLFVSPIVRREAAQGDADAAKRRLEALSSFPELELTTESSMLAQKLVEAKAVPAKFKEDALHIAIAAVGGMDYLVSWNFRHITNAQMIPKIKKVCSDNGMSVRRYALRRCYRRRCKMRHDATLEEMWRIKEELSTAHDTWEEYIADILAFQEEERKRGVKFVSFPPRKPEPAMA